LKEIFQIKFVKIKGVFPKGFLNILLILERFQSKRKSFISFLIYASKGKFPKPPLKFPF